MCCQLGNKPCPHSKESRIGVSSVADTLLRLLIAHSGSLRRAVHEARLWCLASTDHKVSNDGQTLDTKEMANTSEEVEQITDRAMKKGKVPKCQHSVTKDH